MSKITKVNVRIGFDDGYIAKHSWRALRGGAMDRHELALARQRIENRVDMVKGMKHGHYIQIELEREA